MKPFQAPILSLAAPELALAILSMLLLVVAVAGKRENYTLVARCGVFALIAVGTLVSKSAALAGTTFGGMFVSDSFSVYMKLLVITGSAASLLMAQGYMTREKIDRPEFPVLVLLSTLGMMLMISANDMISLYMSLELQSLPLYVLASIRRDQTQSTEAGLKYFVLGALSSGMLLYGMSLVYGFTGATGFAPIAEAVHAQGAGAGVVVGMVLILSGLAFKISAVPFHMWAPDVYEGAPTPVTAFFAIAPKAAALALIARVLTGPFGGMVAEWQQVVIAISMLSMALGGVAAVTQKNIKRLLAYSSIGHMGYALIGLAASSAAGLQGIVIYITLYMIMSIGVFAVVLMMKRKGVMVEEISDLAGLGKQQPALAFIMAALMFSMAGIPPLAGFFGKLFIFQSAVAAGLYTLAIVGVLTSVVAAYYYIRIIKVMYFDDAAQGIDVADDAVLKLVLKASAFVILFFILLPGPLLNSATAAAQSLMK